VRRSGYLFVVGLAAMAAACAVPLGPGFFVERETLDVRFVAAPQPRLEIRARFELTNAGNAPLDGVEFALPGPGYTFTNARAETAGREIARKEFARDAMGSDFVRLRIRFDAPMPLNAKTTVTVAYDLTHADEGTGARIAAEAFFLPPGNWTPRPLRPAGLFAKGGQRPKKFELNVMAPAGFRVHAGGRPRGTRFARGASQVTHRFRIRDDDPEPYVLSGRFFESSYSAHSVKVLFWTPDPLAQEAVQNAGPPLTATARRLTEMYGPLGTHSTSLYLVFGPRRMAAVNGEPVIGEQSASLRAIYPDAVIHDPSNFGLNAVSHANSCSLGVDMASIWFLSVSTPDRETVGRYMADALALRAGALAGDNCFPAIFGAPTRRERAAKALNEFLNHVARQQEMEKDPRKAPDACSFHEIAKRSRRAQLFVHALEEELSAEAVNRALRRMLQGLRGTTWGENDLRAALEAESGRDLGAFFRAWLHSEDIPADFRTKYSTPQN
jgi:hypothetical protein